MMNFLPLAVKCNSKYIRNMIKTFRDRETEKIYSLIFSKKLPTGIQQVALRKLRMINRSVSLDDLCVPPANHLEKLKGNRVGQYAIRINGQWRICFEWHENNAFNVEIVNYHKG